MEVLMVLFRRNYPSSMSILMGAAALGISALVQPAVADVITSFSVGADQTLIYPSTLTGMPDEHTTFLRVPGPSPTITYLVFAASNISGGLFGTVALQTSDLTNFSYAAGYTNPVMVPQNLPKTCNLILTDNTLFDENYSAPGSVVRDPTRPPGHFIMIYEAENHCPGGTPQTPFYATVGFARSTDYGMTWPAAGTKDRRPVLMMNTPEPTTPFPTYMGNAIPSAFVHTTSGSVPSHYIYVPYLFTGGTGADGYLRVARASLDDDPVTFTKWYCDPSPSSCSFSQPGLGGLDSGVTPTRGCAGMAPMPGEYQIQGQISYLAAIDQFLLTFVCVQLSMGTPYQAGWYYSTASSLDLQNWTTPQLITGSLQPVTTCSSSFGTGNSFDGWYPSFMSPDHRPGHLGTTGQVFFLSGCNLGVRFFVSRTFTITTGP
jgi:hypothetical protein